jgi:myo-inositol 2-dehydrogenase/D-chiro-inositol 1-dehydrogenase
MSKSTLMAIMGRMAAYTGQQISWEQALHSKEDLTPAKYDWDLAIELPPVAMPGLTKFF